MRKKVREEVSCSNAPTSKKGRIPSEPAYYDNLCRDIKCMYVCLNKNWLLQMRKMYKQEQCMPWILWLHQSITNGLDTWIHLPLFSIHLYIYL